VEDFCKGKRRDLTTKHTKYTKKKILESKLLRKYKITTYELEIRTSKSILPENSGFGVQLPKSNYLMNY
jgi:hypothetical protein